MVLLMELAYWEVLLFLLMLFGLISVHLFTGRINTKGLLKGTKGDGTQYFSPERVQLLLCCTNRQDSRSCQRAGS